MLAFIFANLVFSNIGFICSIIYFLWSILGIRKRFEKSSNGNRAEFEEHYGFLIENDAQVSDICHNGYQCTETSFNVLGKYI